MKKQNFEISGSYRGIPAILWGESERRIYVAVHGRCGNKEDEQIRCFAEMAVNNGFRVLSFDLPQHGQRQQEEGYPCSAKNGCADVETVCRFASELAEEVCVFACSVGAYFTMLAYPALTLRELLFLSPVTDMNHLLQGMMTQAGITVQKLEQEKRVILSEGLQLDWNDYCYVQQHPVLYDSLCPAAILYGARDTLCRRSDVERFAACHHVRLTIYDQGEHYFHTAEQMKVLSDWLMLCFAEDRQVRDLVETLENKDHSKAYVAMEKLEEISRKKNLVYPYFDRFAAMLEDGNSYVRNRGIHLIAANAMWDDEGKLNWILDEYLTHLHDPRPVTARHCLNALGEIAAAKPRLTGRIIQALETADFSCYTDSMCSLLEKERGQLLQRIKK